MSDHAVDEAVLNAVMTASRTMVAVVTQSLGAVAEDRRGLIRRDRARADRRAVQVSITDAGREVVDQATARRRELIVGILGRLPARRQPAVAGALGAFDAAAGEVPDNQWSARPPQAPPAADSGRPSTLSAGEAS